MEAHASLPGVPREVTPVEIGSAKHGTVHRFGTVCSSKLELVVKGTTYLRRMGYLR